MSVATKQDLDLVRWFDQISMDDVAIVGGKNASLGEMYRELTPAAFACPTISLQRWKPIARFCTSRLWTKGLPKSSRA